MMWIIINLHNWQIRIIEALIKLSNQNPNPLPLPIRKQNLNLKDKLSSLQIHFLLNQITYMYYLSIYIIYSLKCSLLVSPPPRATFNFKFTSTPRLNRQWVYLYWCNMGQGS